jgi:hypothetical protein
MKNLLKFLLVGGSIMCLLSMVFGGCSTTKKAKPCKQCPQYTEIPENMTHTHTPSTTNTFINLTKI